MLLLAQLDDLLLVDTLESIEVALRILDELHMTK